MVNAWTVKCSPGDQTSREVKPTPLSSSRKPLTRPFLFLFLRISLQKFHFYVRTPLKTSFLIEYFLKKTSFPSRKFSSALRSQSTFTDDTQLRWPQTDKDMELVADTVILYCFKESHSINEVALCFQIVFSLKEILLNLKKTFSNIKKQYRNFRVQTYLSCFFEYDFFYFWKCEILIFLTKWTKLSLQNESGE